MNVKDLKDIQLSTVGKDDYPELEGEIIVYEYSDGQQFDVLVVGCNRSVGLTLVDVHDKEEKFLCLIGPAAPGGKDFWQDYYEFTYDEAFDFCVEAIKDGYLHAGKLDELYLGSSRGGGEFNPTCAYSF